MSLPDVFGKANLVHACVNVLVQRLSLFKEGREILDRHSMDSI